LPVTRGRCIASIPTPSGFYLATSVSNSDSATGTIGTIFGDWLLASLNSVTHLSAVHTLDLAPVFRLWTIAGEMASLFAVTASSGSGIAGLVTLLSDMILGTAVAACSRASLFNVGAFLGEVSHLVALSALDPLSRAWLGAFLGVVTLLLAVPAGMGIDALFGAVTGTVTSLLAVDTNNGGGSRLALSNLLFAVFADVTKFYERVSDKT
jgi:hypothetical protein